MNRLIKGNWVAVKRSLRDRFNLTADDLNFNEGQEEQLLDSLQHRLGKSQNEVVNILNEVNSKMI